MTDSALSYYPLPGLPVLACEYPHHPVDAALAAAKRATLAELGVTHVLDLTELGEGMAAWPDDVGFAPTRSRFPIPDRGTPSSPLAFDALIDELGERVQRGEVIAVHCWGGIGRTGTVAAALLVRFGWPVEVALAEVEAQWRRVPKASELRHRDRTAPETDAQREFVRAWARAVSSRPALPSPHGVSPRATRACLLGGALGDALGAAVEFLDLPAIRARYGPQGVRRPMPEYGVDVPITDDTQMTLFTAEGLLRARAASTADDVWLVSPDHARHDAVTSAIGDAYVRWLATQEPASVPATHRTRTHPPGLLLAQPSLHRRRAPGNTCLSALRHYAQCAVPPRVARNQSKGCGAVMRIAPIGLAAPTPEAAFALALQASALTHGHVTGMVAGGAFAVLLQQRAAGVPLLDALEVARDCSRTHRGHEETVEALDRAQALASTRGSRMNADDLLTLGEGWVAEEALAIAVACALAQPDQFVEATCLAANLVRGDSDSTASMTGQLVGLQVGVEGLPSDWLASLELRDVITQVADDLAVGWRPGRAWQERWPAVREARITAPLPPPR